VATRIDAEKFRDMIASGEIQLPDSYKTDFGFVDELDEDDPNFQGLFSMYNRFMDPVKQFVGPAINTLTGIASGIPGAGFLLNALSRTSQPNVPNPLAIGVFRDPSTGFFRDRFGYNVGPTILESNFLKPGTSSFRSYALEGLRSLDKQKADDFYRQNYGLTFNQVKEAIQDKQNPFGRPDPNIGTSDYQGDVGPTGRSTSGPNVEGSVSRGGTDDTAGTPFKRGGIVDLYG
tara:strand:- start:2533 stop:3228 length:696 start_codon:yes stop_codon:yes gene_type:complete